MPLLYILAGANGTGKTTYYLTAIQQQFIDSGLPFLNVDLIAKNELGGFTPDNFVNAEMIFRQRAGELIKDKKDFMIESNLANSNDYIWIENMIKHGFEIILFFMCTGDLNVNINRVERRVREGGHNIPVEIIIHRYKIGLTYLKGKLHLFKEVFLIDNATDEAIEVAHVKNGHLTKEFVQFPKWADDLLYIIKRMK